MKKIFTLSLVLLFVTMHGQDTLTLQGFPRTCSLSHSDQVDTLVRFNSRVNLINQVCSIASDSSYEKTLILLEGREFSEGSMHLTLLDMVEVDDYSDSLFIIIGSNEFEENSNLTRSGFVISMECCYDSTGIGNHYKSETILRVWCSYDEKLIEINPEEIVRYNEGFYKKSRLIEE